MAKRTKAISFLPTAAVLEMGYECNHTCLFCSCPWEHNSSNYIKDKNLTTEDWMRCIEKLASMGVTSFSFTGGEPLLNPGFNEIIEFTGSLKVKNIDKSLNEVEKTPDLFLISNGQLMSDEILRLLIKHNVNLSMSLPGIQTYNDHTQSGSADNILAWFRKAHEAKLNTTVNITVTRKNLHELYETISNALINGADNLLLNRFMPGGRGLYHVEELILNKEETLQMLKIADEVLVKANRKGSVGTELPICLIEGLSFKNLTVGTQCSAAVDFFVVGPEGRIRTCNHSPVQLEHYSEIEKVKNNNVWKRFVTKDYLPEMCVGCKQVHLCDGGCREAARVFHGNLDSPDPIFSGN